MQGNNDTIGFLEVLVKTANGALPVEGAQVMIYDYSESDKGQGRGDLMYSLVTDENGRAPRVALATKSKELSTSPGNENPFSIYNIRIAKDGYYNNSYSNVPIFQGITSLQPVNLIPLLEYGLPNDDYPLTEERFVTTPSTKL